MCIDSTGYRGYYVCPYSTSYTGYVVCPYSTGYRGYVLLPYSCVWSVFNWPQFGSLTSLNWVPKNILESKVGRFENDRIANRLSFDL